VQQPRHPAPIAVSEPAKQDFDPTISRIPSHKLGAGRPCGLEMSLRGKYERLMEKIAAQIGPVKSRLVTRKSDEIVDRLESTQRRQCLLLDHLAHLGCDRRVVSNPFAPALGIAALADRQHLLRYRYAHSGADHPWIIRVQRDASFPQEALAPSIDDPGTWPEQKIDEPQGSVDDGVEASSEKNSAEEVTDRLDNDEPPDQRQIAISCQQRASHLLDLHGGRHGVGLTSVMMMRCTAA
jgi:hypothetical protein